MLLGMLLLMVTTMKLPLRLGWQALLQLGVTRGANQASATFAAAQ
jgi:hypothetical protein